VVGNKTAIEIGRLTEVSCDVNRVVLRLEKYFIAQKLSTPDDSVLKTMNQYENPSRQSQLYKNKNDR
jgi:hypothetical protein